MATQLQLSHLFGRKGSILRGVEYTDEHILLYPCGNLIVVFNNETKTQRFIVPSENGERITALGLSANRRLLAVAEVERDSRTGVTISIFDTSSLKRKKIISYSQIAQQHGGHSSINSNAMVESFFGGEVVDLSFSADGKYLLAQGSSPDWVLTCWSWEKSKLASAVKVSNLQGAEIYQASFSPGDSLVCCVTGNGILKHFRLQDGNFKAVSTPTLKREPSNNLSHCWISEDRLVVATDTGELVLMENQEFRGLLGYEGASEGLPITNLQAYSKGFLCGSGQSTLRVFEETDEAKEYYVHTKTFQVQGEVNQRAHITSMAFSPSEDNLACALSNFQTYTLSFSNTDILKAEEMSFDLLSVPVHGPGQGGSAQITGMDVCFRKPLLATCGLDRTVRVWNYLEQTVDLMKRFPEEAYSIAFHPSGLFVLVGFADKLRLMNLLMDDIRPFKEFPIKASRECRFSHGGQYFAAANGNSVQIFRTYTFECIATLRSHASKVRSIVWSVDDRMLVTSGLDGGVFRWTVASGARESEFQAKGTKFSCVVSNVDASSVHAVGSDNTFYEIEFPGETVKQEVHLAKHIGQVTVTRSGKSMFAGSSHPDASGSVFSLKLPLQAEPELLELRCHSGPVTRMSTSPDGGMLFSASEDGSLAIFAIREVGGGKKHEKDALLPFTEEILVTKSDLVEQTEVMRELKHKVDEMTLHNEYQLRLKDLNYNEKLKEITTRFTQEIEDDREKYEALGKEKQALEETYETRIKALEEQQRTELEQVETTYQGKINSELERYQQLVEVRNELNRKAEEENALLIESHETYLNELTAGFEQKIVQEGEERDRITTERFELIQQFEQTRKEIEEDADIEVRELKEKFGSRLSAEREATLRLKGENGIMKKKFSSLQNDIEEQHQRIKALMDREQELYENIKGLEKDIQGHKKEIREREETIQDKEKRIYDLKKKNQELEKFKFVLDYKIKELKRQIEPRESEIADMRQQIKEMDLELDQYHKSNAALDLMIGELKLKIEGMQNEVDDQKEKIQQGEAMSKKCRSELHDIMQQIDDTRILKNGIIALYKSYVQRDSALASKSADESKGAVKHSHVQKQYSRQREYLEKSVESLKRKLTKDLKSHNADNMRLMRESVDLTNEINRLRRELTLLQKNGSNSANKLLANETLTLTPGQREIRMQRLQLERMDEQIRNLERTLGV